jgi:hypothetical protein
MTLFQRLFRLNKGQLTSKLKSPTPPTTPDTNTPHHHMKQTLTTLILAAGLVVGSIHAATPEQEKAFVAAYKKAFEAKDEKALAGFLYTTGATEETIGFFKMMQTAEAGAPITSIELVTPSKEEAAKLNQPMEMPDGKKYKMPIAPTKQLVLVVEHKSADGSSKSTSKSPVAEKDGKLVIPVPVPADAAAPKEPKKAPAKKAK